MKTLKQIERDLIVERLEMFQGNKFWTAKSLGVCYKTLNNKIFYYGIPKIGKGVTRFAFMEPVKTYAEIEETIIKERLEEFKNNKSAAACSLGLSLKGFYNKLNSYIEETTDEEVKRIETLQARRENKQWIWNSATEERLMNDPDFTGYRDVTPDERDKWYNKDFF